MQVIVRLGEPIRRVAGSIRLTLHFEADTVSVADVLARLGACYPGFDAALAGAGLRWTSPYRFFVNARQVLPDAFDAAQLADGDKLSIFLPAIGGAGAPPLPASFYLRPTLEVARALLGCLLVRTLAGERVSGRIVEVEAYIGDDDLASHAARGRTPRNWPMFAAGGLSYVYFIYGMYYCLNVATEAEGFPAAILLRGLEPVEGIEPMRRNRGGQPDRSLVDGPGKLCQALQIDRALNGHDLTAGRELWIEPGQPVPAERIRATPRVNVGGDDRARALPWRFLATKRWQGEGVRG